MDEWREAWQSPGAGGGAAAGISRAEAHRALPHAALAALSPQFSGYFCASSSHSTQPGMGQSEAEGCSLPVEMLALQKGIHPPGGALGLHPLPTRSLVGQSHVLVPPLLKNSAMLLNIVPWLAPGSTGTSPIPFQSCRNILQPNQEG